MIFTYIHTHIHFMQSVSRPHTIQQQQQQPPPLVAIVKCVCVCVQVILSVCLCVSDCWVYFMHSFAMNPICLLSDIDIDSRDVQLADISCNDLMQKCMQSIDISQKSQHTLISSWDCLHSHWLHMQMYLCCCCSLSLSLSLRFCRDSSWKCNKPNGHWVQKNKTW